MVRPAIAPLIENGGKDAASSEVTVEAPADQLEETVSQ
jgi:hypothetical protein